LEKNGKELANAYLSMDEDLQGIFIDLVLNQGKNLPDSIRRELYG